MKTGISPAGNKPDGVSHRQHGFTLIELLLVISIVAMLTSLAAPAISRVLPGTQLKGATRQVAASLRLARDRAISLREEVAMHIDIRHRTYRLSHESRLHHLPEGIAISVLGAEQESAGETIGGVRFYADGSSTGGQVRLSRGEKAYAIDVDWLLGRVSIND